MFTGECGGKDQVSRAAAVLSVCIFSDWSKTRGKIKSGIFYFVKPCGNVEILTGKSLQIYSTKGIDGKNRV